MAARHKTDKVKSKSDGVYQIESTPVRRTFINGDLAAVLTSVNGDGSVIITGSDNTIIEGLKAARILDKTSLGKVITSSRDVLVNKR